MSKNPYLPGKFVWFEHLSSDPKKAQAFYGEVLGWKVESFPMGDFTYDMIATKTGTVGGYAQPKDARTAAHWISYASVTDIDATLKAITAAGGKVVEAAYDVPTIGRMARVADPLGAELSLFQSVDGDEPDQPASHGRFDWNELSTTDPDKALAFYTKVLGYSHKAMDMGPIGTYLVLEKGGVPRAGILKAPPGVPTGWLPYVTVDDCDAAAARAARHGGQVMAAPADIPGVGRFAVITDVAGAGLGVIKPAAK
jgi:predicted enzyme related to lactoylglutathione lyase